MGKRNKALLWVYGVGHGDTWWGQTCTSPAEQRLQPEGEPGQIALEEHTPAGNRISACFPLSCNPNLGAEKARSYSPILPVPLILPDSFLCV